MAILDIKQSMDVMQHIREIYKILGTTEPLPEGILERIEALESGTKLFVGTKVEYEEAYGSGQLEDTICFITDDFIK